MTDQQQQDAQNQSMSAEEFKVQLLKNNFAKRCTAYEDEIADLQVQIALLQQQLRGEQGSTQQPAPPPAPPQTASLDRDIDLEPQT